MQLEFFEHQSAAIKALTLWQPYAQAVALELKKFETRGWPTNYRGLLAIHASVRKVSKEHQALADKYKIKEFPTGVVVAIVDLVDCIPMTPEFIRQQSPQEIEWGDWQPGRWAWKLENVKELAMPPAVKGAQGLWNLKNVEIHIRK